MVTTELVRETLRLAQRLGFFGPGDLEPALSHADHFVQAIPVGAQLVTDLGSGGGLPGLVIAAARAELSVRLVERRQTRADFLERAVGRLQMADRVSVLTVDVTALLFDSDHASRSDVVTARGFAHPAVLAPLAASLVRPGGLIVVSDPPGGAGHRRWLDLPLADWSLKFAGTDGVVSVLRRSAVIPTS